jgi:hypothetical protein
MSSVNEEIGSVLTKNEIFSPARTLVLEQYPSIQGQLTWVLGSVRVLVNIHSRVPGLSFSRKIGLLAPEMGFFLSLQLESRGNAPRLAANFRKSRRPIVDMCFLFTGKIIRRS